MKNNHNHKLTLCQINAFETYLRDEEREEATIKKYVHYTYDFFMWLHGVAVTKATAVEWKEYLQKEVKLAPSTINAKIASGEIFLTRSGKGISRRQIWTEMKAICKAAGVESTKVFPHNLRHLFARVYYRVYHDIVKLADI